MKQFDIIDISGDAGIRAYGDTVEGLFVSAAEGMYSLITDIEKVREKEKVTINIESHSMEGLLVSWLNELIFRFDTYGFVGKTIAITGLTPSCILPSQEGTYSIEASVSGENFDPGRHERRLLLKAATYHQLSIERKDGLWAANIIFDI